MALIGSGKGYSKKDINFFEEYTAAARKTARYLAYFIFAALVVIAIFVIWWFIAFLQNNAIKKDIQAMEARIASEEFKDVEKEATNIEADLAKRNQQLYAMSSMRQAVDTKTSAGTNVMQLLIENLPSEVYIAKYELTGDVFTIEGYAFTDYAALELVNMVQDDQNIFNSDRPTMIEMERVNDKNVLNDDGTIRNRINCFYKFVITGNLTNKVTVGVSSYANLDSGVIALDAVRTYTYDYNDTYVNDNILEFEYNGVVYTLTSVQVNGVEVSAEQFAEIQANAKHVISNLTDNVDVTYYYTVAVAATEEGGEA
ncbi:MAG: hypothetical protein MJ108_01675 [Saccharofermentans sp.]|nr:hypothetical protein [Saccharofermentans sp.]